MFPDKWTVTDIIFVNLGHFLPFYLLPFFKVKFEKTKKTPKDAILLHMCTINEDNMMYGS